MLEVISHITLVTLGVALLVAFIRIVKGPTLPDRIVAMDLVGMLVVGVIVVLAGLCLGPMAGAASMTLFLLAGAVGLPVFAPMGLPGIARLAGPTGGYLLAYPAAAFVAGWLGMRASGMMLRSVAAFAGMLVIYVGGVAQIAFLTGSVSQAVVLGAVPFIALDALKAIIAAAIAPRRTPPAAA